MSKIKIKTGNFLVVVLINLISLSIFSSVELSAKDVNPEFVQVGEASWYGPGFQGRKTANGERFDTYEMTAAHKTLPFNTLVKVTNLHNEQTVVVRINDRGPFIRGRIIDLSKAAKEEIGMGGLAQVRLEIYNPEEEAEVEEVEENLAPVNLFSEVMPVTSRIFVLINGLSNADGEISNEQLNEMFKEPKIKLKVLTPDMTDANLNIYEIAPDTAGNNYFEITDKIRFVEGYSIEVARFADTELSEELITKLEKEEFKNIFVEELINGNKKQVKILVGNYEDPDDSKKDLIRILELDPKLTTKIVKIGG